MGKAGACSVLVFAMLVSASEARSPVARRVQPSTLRSPGNEVVYVWKSRRLMQLREGDRIVREFQIALGLNPKSRKEVRGDLRTPVGKYFISERRKSSRFTYFLGLSYPNINDAERGYKKRLINADQWAEIFLANLRTETPPQRTLLGGRVGIHGHGGRPEIGVDWTEGCIALKDEEIRFLYERVSVGTPVIIYE